MVVTSPGGKSQNATWRIIDEATLQDLTAHGASYQDEVDTIMAESFSASLGRIEGDIVDRSPTTSLLHYELILDNRGRIAQAHATQHAATGALLYDVTLDRTPKGFGVVIHEGDSTRRRFVPYGAFGS